MKPKLPIILFLFCANVCLAQESFYYDLTVENGLPDNTVYDMHLSQEGFLYAATDRGFAKYDGKKFEEIVFAQRKLEMTAFQEMANGHLFFLTFNGMVFCYNNDSTSLIRDLGEEGLTFPTIQLLNENEVVFTAYDGYYSYQIDSGVRYFKLPNVKQKRKLKSLILGRTTNGVLIVCGQKIYHVNRQHVAREVKATNDLLNFKFALQWKGRDLIFSQDDKNNLVLFELINEEVVLVQNCGQIKSKLLNVSLTDNRLFVLTREGAFELDDSYQVIDNNKILIKDITKLIIRNGSYYISTLNSGIRVIPNYEVKNASRLFENETPITLYNFKDQLFYATESGKLKVALPTKHFSNIRFNNSFNSTLDNEGNLFILSDKNAYLVNLNTGANSKLKSNHAKTGKGYYSKFFDAYFLSYLNRQVVLTDNVQSYNRILDSYQFEKAELFEGKLTSNSRTNKIGRVTIEEEPGINACFNNSDSSFYLLSFYGVKHYYPNRKVVKLHVKGQRLGAFEAMPTSDGCFYMTTDHGICKVKGDSVIKIINTSNGILMNLHKDVKQQGDTLILIGDETLQIYTEKSGVILTLSTNDYLPRATIYDAAIRKGLVYVSTSKGAFSIPLQLEKQDSPKAFIRYLAAGKSRWQIGESIPFSRNDIIFRINGNAILQRGAFHYEYKLQGANNDNWIEQDASFNDIRFSSLAEGDYVLNLKVVTEVGVESKVVSYPFTINPPFVRSNLFYLLCFLVALGIISFIFWLRVRAIRRKSEFERQVKQSEITAIKAQMNPHFLFNALNSIQSWIVMNDVRKSNAYLGKFSELVRKTLEASEKNALPLDKELDIIELYLDIENLRFGKEIEIDLEINIEEARQKDILIPAMLIQPYIENVFKHGLLHKKGSKKLSVLFDERDGKLYCEIEDNGVGRIKSGEINQTKRKHKSFSSDANRKRIDLLNELFNGEIELRIEDAFPNETDCGTRVILILPLLDYDSLKKKGA